MINRARARPGGSCRHQQATQLRQHRKEQRGYLEGARTFHGHLDAEDGPRLALHPLVERVGAGAVHLDLGEEGVFGALALRKALYLGVARGLLRAELVAGKAQNLCGGEGRGEGGRFGLL